MIGFSCVCVVTDLSKYAGGLEVLLSEKDPTSVVSLEVSTHPTLEAGEKHEITKLLYDAVFSEPASSLRCAIPRGSQLDLGQNMHLLFHMIINSVIFFLIFFPS